MPFTEITLFILGFLTGAFILWAIMSRSQKTAKELAEELSRHNEMEKIREMEKMVGQIRESFGSLSMEALSKSTGEFIKLANQQFYEQSKRNEDNLQNKKQLIDQSLVGMKEELGKVQNLVGKIENERKQTYGELSEQIKNSVHQTQKLQDTANQLNTALSHSQVRGQWGERMAEDVLRMAGLVEGINYHKQKSVENASSRPDFTFILPKDLLVNMDVKFPLTNYLSFLAADSDMEKAKYKTQFLKDVRLRIKEVTNRNYINPANNTVDYMIVFIPNEQVYAFINESDHTILDEALKNKVILSSPITLYAILSVIRQAVENFNLERTTEEILNILADFNKQWDLYKEGMDKMGHRLEAAQKEFLSLITTRTNKLEKPLQKIDLIRNQNETLSLFGD